MTAGWQASRSAWPQPPQHVTAQSPFLKGVIDLRWDDPAQLLGNEGWLVRGINIYRSTGSDRGPFRRLNSAPIGSTLYRDSSRLIPVHNELIREWVFKGNNAEDPYHFKTNLPIARTGTNGEPSNSGRDVIVTVDGVVVPVMAVNGAARDVFIHFRALPNAKTWRYDNPLLDNLTDTSVVTISYMGYIPEDRLGGDQLHKKNFYRLTTVAEDYITGELFETPIDHTRSVSDQDIEQIDYIWREGARRNQWILEQGGERVKFFTRRVNGTPCNCTDFDFTTLQYGKQPDSRCLACFGTGILGGYDGPYDMIIAPDDAEKRVSQSNQGRRKEHSYEVWIGPSPIVSQRDFLVKLNNDRYSIGAVRSPTNRGVVLQQHFNVGYLDSGDIRYKVPVEGVPSSWNETKYSYRPGLFRETYSARSDAPWSDIADKNFPIQNDRKDLALEQKGRTGTWENQNSGG